MVLWLFVCFFCPMGIKLKNKKQNETATPNEKKKIWNTPKIRLPVQSLVGFLYTYSMQNCMLNCKTEKPFCQRCTGEMMLFNNCWLYWFFLSVQNDTFILHDYSTHSGDRIIHFLQYLSTLQELVSLYDILFIQRNWGADMISHLTFTGGEFYFFWVCISTSYVQKADPLNFIFMNEEPVKH